MIAPATTTKAEAGAAGQGSTILPRLPSAINALQLLAVHCAAWHVAALAAGAAVTLLLVRCAA